MTADTQVLTDEQMFQILLDHGIGWETGRGLEPMSADDESGCDYIKALRAIEAAVLSASAGEKKEQPDLLSELEGIVHFADGFHCYHDQGPLGIELRRWIEGARSAIAASKSNQQDAQEKGKE